MVFRRSGNLDLRGMVFRRCGNHVSIDLIEKLPDEPLPLPLPQWEKTEPGRDLPGDKDVKIAEEGRRLRDPGAASRDAERDGGISLQGAVAQRLKTFQHPG